MIRSFLTLLVLLSLFAFVTDVKADTFRCPNGNLVSTGDKISIVAIKCDQPSYVSKWTESESGSWGATLLINVEEWTYNEGPHRFIRILTFRNGILEKIETVGYGS